MNISRRWLAEFLPPSALPDDDALAALLTGRGLEIESRRVLASRGLIAGKITSAEKHPDAAKLHICRVDIGGGAPSVIVCGAANVAAGLSVVVAPPGANVGGRTMQKRAFRGVESAGMICSAAEIGIGGGDGVMILADGEAKPGQSLDEYLHLPDTVLDAGITPNRGDCLSHLGIAREIAAAAGESLPSPPTGGGAALDEIFAVEIAAPDACPYYGCVVVRGADVSRPSPWPMRALLERCGVRPISAAVDITNYVMLATGQPLHAFDLDKLSGGIRVRMAKDGEELVLLNGDAVRCEADTPLICDGRDRGVAMAGVMGGMDSAVGAATENILLEGAFFSPAAVRGKTVRHRLTSEAAHRFERGVDPLLPPRALSFAAKLLAEICGGKAGPVHSAGAPPPSAPPMRAAAADIRGRIGIAEWDAAEIARLLNAAGVPAEAGRDEEIVARPPSWRFDLESSADLAEEAIRARGYDALPEIPPPGGINIAACPPLPFSPANARRRLASLGFSEVITYAFVPPRWEEKLQSGRGAPVVLRNPIHREMSVMRTTLLGGLIDRALFNLNHRQNRMRLFEIGRCFVAGKEDAPWDETQPLFVAGLAAGDSVPAQWGERARECDFFDMKGGVEMFLRPAEEAIFCDDAPRPAFLHPRQSANIVVTFGGAARTVGAVGILHPQIAAAFGFRRPPPVFEICLRHLAETRRVPKASPVSRFPPARRDLSVVADAPARAVLECVRAAAPDDMHCAAALFDLYENANIGDGKKCYGVRLSMQGIDKNLTEDDIRRVLDATVAALSAAGMELRR
ncbi:MAG: phenylalanine--tRNA ligase subunit beta [Gammaproteobacteria bacterium]